MTSSPNYLKKTGHLNLAIKYSSWPPSYWIHTQVKFWNYEHKRRNLNFFDDNRRPAAYEDVWNGFCLCLFQCKVGSEVSIRTGGDFFFDSTKMDNIENILLLAGGVGINPLASMVNQIHDEKTENPSTFKRVRTSLLFSAKIKSELLFKVKKKNG